MAKKWILTLSLLQLIAFEGQAQGEGTLRRKAPPSNYQKFEKVFLGEKSLSVSAGPSYWNYREPGVMAIEGPAVKLHGEWKDRVGDSSALYRLQGEYMQGAMSYDGSYQDGRPLKAQSYDSSIETRALLQINAVDSPFNSFGLNAGVGYRFWYNLVQAPGGYRRQISYVYLPIGAEYNGRMSDTSAISLFAEYDFFVSGVVKSSLSDANPRLYSDVENKQSKGFGTRVGGRYSWALENSSIASLFVQPQWNYWKVENSDISVSTGAEGANYMLEPANDTSLILLDMGVIF